MRVEKRIACAVALCFLQIYCIAQEKSKVVFGRATPQDFALPAIPIIDSNSNAVILSDVGSINFTGNKSGWFSHVYKRQTRIKILNKKAFELATVRVSLRSRDDVAEKMDNLVASTYNLEEGGKVLETKLDKNEVFEEREDKNHTLKKFTMPAVKEGSIIEYAYTITSDFNRFLPSWEFQSEEYPCLWSEYNVNIPQALFYVFTRHGVHGFCIDKAGQGHESYRVTEKPATNSLANVERDLVVDAITIKHQWAMKEIPAFHVENYLSTPRNYLDRMEFQLSGTYDGQDKFEHTTSWAKATEELLKKEDFGAPLKEENEFLNGIVDQVTKDITDPLAEAKAIYYYVRNNFTCTNHYDPYVKTTLKDFLKRNSGTVGDLNLLLVVLLRKSNIAADPVLLSTREVGFNPSQYPVMAMLNYLVVRARVGEKVYYLDAAQPLLGFGQLAGNCYNGHARIISDKDSGSVFFWADSLKERKSTMVFVYTGEKGELSGTCQSVLGLQESYNTRNEVNRKGEKNYFKDIQTAYGEDIQIAHTGIDSLHRPEDPLKVNYEFTMKQALGAPLIYFNPMFGEAWRQNPFKAAERKYPVEMPYAMDNVYTFNMEIPEGYVVDELPKSVKVAYNGSQGLFQYLVAQEGSTIQMQCRLKLDQAYFPAEDYPSLRDFFAFVVKKESEPIVLKKK